MKKRIIALGLAILLLFGVFAAVLTVSAVPSEPIPVIIMFNEEPDLNAVVRSN